MAGNAPEILCLGEALVDVIPSNATPGNATPSNAIPANSTEKAGGSPFNVACGLGRLGHSVALGSWWAADSPGKLLTDQLAASQVDILPGSDRAAHTSTATVTLDSAGNASYDFQIDWQLPHLPNSATPAHIHTGSIAAVLAPGAGQLRDFIAHHRAATVSYDPNIRPAIMPPPAVTLPQVESLIAQADLVKASAEDVAWLYSTAVTPTTVTSAAPTTTTATPTPTGVIPLPQLQQIADHWLQLGAKLVVITRGAAGAIAKAANGLTAQFPAAHVNVADTVGAGDSFMAGLISSLYDAALLGTTDRTIQPPLTAITAAQLTAALARATACAAVTVTHAGAYAPSFPELSQALLSRSK